MARTDMHGWFPARLFGLRCVEPQKRLVGGRFGWAFHRFEIKGGITPHDAMLSDLASRTPLLAKLQARMRTERVDMVTLSQR